MSKHNDLMNKILTLLYILLNELSQFFTKQLFLQTNNFTDD